MNPTVVNGDRIELSAEMEDLYPIPVGTQGTVVHVDRWSIQVDWDNGRSLGLIPEADQFIKIDNPKDPS